MTKLRMTRLFQDEPFGPIFVEFSAQVSGDDAAESVPEAGGDSPSDANATYDLDAHEEELHEATSTLEFPHDDLDLDSDSGPLDDIAEEFEFTVPPGSNASLMSELEQPSGPAREDET